MASELGNIWSWGMSASRETRGLAAGGTPQARRRGLRGFFPLSLRVWEKAGPPCTGTWSVTTHPAADTGDTWAAGSVSPGHSATQISVT